MTDPNTLARELHKKATECCQLIERLERSGNRVHFRIDWQPGLTSMFQSVRCWEPEIDVNGIEVRP